MNHTMASPSFSPGLIPPPPAGHPQARSPAPNSNQYTAHNSPRHIYGDFSAPSFASSSQGLPGGSPLTSPHVATSAHSPIVAGGHQAMAARAFSAGGAVVGYNPQQWGAHGSSGVEFVPHTALAPTARPSHPEDGISEPPPPYTQEPSAQSNSTPPPPSQSHSPPHHTSGSGVTQQRTPSAFTSATSSTNNAFNASSSISRANVTSINPQPMTSFPPPPGAPGSRDRSSSRTGRSRFGLSALARGMSSDRSFSNSSDPLNTQHAGISGTHVIPRPRPGVAGRAGSVANRSSVYVQSTQSVPEPPAARRSASAGAGPQQSLHLPPPPPGPPPAAPRTARGEAHHRNGSVQLGETLVPILSMPMRRPPRILPGGTSLGPVPPTPADWNENRDNSIPPPLPVTHSPEASDTVETQDEAQEPSQPEDRISMSSSRAYEVRDSTVKGLRERRSESRQARDRDLMSPDGDDPRATLETQLADLTLNLNSSHLYRQGAVKKSRSSMSPKDPPSATRIQVSGKKAVHHTTTHLDSNAQTPVGAAADTPNSARVLPMALPTPPLTEHSNFNPSQYQNLTRQSSAAGKRRAVVPEASDSDSAEHFARASLERHQLFMQQESSATSDRERLELFAEYIVMESRLRRDRYASAFSGMASDILDLTRDLWRPMTRQVLRTRNDTTPVQTTSGKREESRSQRPVITARQNSIDSENTESPLSSRANWTPRSDSESPTSTPSAGPRETNFRQYQPVLSPIPSMAMSTVPDGESRGRSASRWWESDDGSTGAGRQVERTKRESKYMGLGRVARFNLQYEDETSPALFSASTPGQQASSSQYPPEKTGWHDSGHQDSLATPQFYSVPNTPSATVGLDVSRLVTLPPPYPRHYPAVNNAHPDLSTLRTTIRSLNEVAVIKESKDRFEQKLSHQRAVAAQDLAARIAQMRHNVSEQVQSGQMSFADAATAEEHFHKQEAKEAQAQSRRQYEQFKPDVHDPLLALLSERVKQATASIKQLNEGLSASASESGPDAPMEEGDECPELLEKLKLLKWLAEAREMLNREMFNLESERCDRYRDLIIADLRSRGEAARKIDEALQFFQKDSLDRWVKFERDAQSRVAELISIIGHYVDRGVQDQLSAFWDIGPGLLEVVKKIPLDADRLAVLRISIPHAEMAENPDYNTFPLQYLYGLLCHAEKATYQFIDNQIGLWCLYNEVGVSVMRAQLAVMRAERCIAAGCARDDPDMVAETANLATDEEDHLNHRLKDRVAEVESQWKEALGSDLSAVLEKVEWVLRETGGWDDSLQD